MKSKEPRTTDYKGRDLTEFCKIQLLKYFRFDRQNELVCTECINNSDITAIKGDKLTEVEIKISKEDFLKEFSNKSKIKKLKHTRYISGRKYSKYIVPNYFYFCCPKHIKTKDGEYLYRYIEKYLKENGYTNYGILIVEENRNFNRRSHITTYKSPKCLNKFTIKQSTIESIYKRLTSEVISLKDKILQKQK